MCEQRPARGTRDRREGAVIRAFGLAGFFSSDAHYAPFGLAWLRGLTASRVGVVLTVCVLYTLHSVSESIALGFTSTSALGLPIKLAIICLSAAPFTLLVTIVDNVSDGWSTSRRAFALTLAVTAGAASAGWLEASMYEAIVTGPPPGNAALWDSYASYISEVLDAYPADFLLAPLGTFWGIPFIVWTGFSMHWLMYGTLLTAVYFFVTRERAAAAALHESRTLRQSLDRQMTEPGYRCCKRKSSRISCSTRSPRSSVSH